MSQVAQNRRQLLGTERHGRGGRGPAGRAPPARRDRHGHDRSALTAPRGAARRAFPVALHVRRWRRLRSIHCEHLSGLPPVARLPRPRPLGHRRQAARLAAGALGSTCGASRGTSSRWRRPAPARPPSRCGSPPSCWPTAPSYGGHRGRADRAPEEPVGRGGARGSGIQLDPTFRNADGRTSARLPRRRPSPTRRWRRRPQLHRRPHRGPPHPGHPRRDPPRRRLAGPGATAVREAFEPADARLALTGTPFRSDDNPIPFVSYEQDGDGHAALASPTTPTATADALRDGVVRPVIFLAYSGEMRWRTKAGDELAARLGEPMTKDADRAGLAHRAGPGRRLDAAGAARPPTSG